MFQVLSTEIVEAMIAPYMPVINEILFLGKGQYGQVFSLLLATQERVAIKLIPLGFREALVVKPKPNWDWLHLTRHLSHVRHQRLVGIRGLFECESPHHTDEVKLYGCIVMDYWPMTLEAYVLDQYTKEKPQFSWCVELLLQVVEGYIDLKHRMQLIQTDIKPDNILVRPYGNWALDWVIGDIGSLQRLGIASYHRAHLPTRWMPSEVIQNKNLSFDESTLVFSFAVLAFFILEGRYPIDNQFEGVPKLVDWLTENDDLDWLVPAVAPEQVALRALLRECLSVNALSRPQSFEHVQQQLISIKNAYRDRYKVMFRSSMDRGVLGLSWSYVPTGSVNLGQSEDETDWLVNQHGKRYYDKHFAEEIRLLQTDVKAGYFSQTPVTVRAFSLFVAQTGYVTDAERDGYSLARQDDGRWAEGTQHWRDPGFEQGYDHPVVCVSWFDAMAYCNWLSEQLGAVCRLATEAEWVYACVSGRLIDAQFYAAGWHSGHVKPIESDIVEGEVLSKYIGRTAPVMSRPANSWGLYDMQGNVWEWCLDSFIDSELVHECHKNKVALPVQPWKVRKGGSWRFTGVFSRPAYRRRGLASTSAADMGFRVWMELPCDFAQKVID